MGNTTVEIRPSYLHNAISYAGKMASFYWFSPHVTVGLVNDLASSKGHIMTGTRQRSRSMTPHGVTRQKLLIMMFCHFINIKSLYKPNDTWSIKYNTTQFNETLSKNWIFSFKEKPSKLKSALWSPFWSDNLHWRRGKLWWYWLCKVLTIEMNSLWDKCICNCKHFCCEEKKVQCFTCLLANYLATSSYY